MRWLGWVFAAFFSAFALVSACSATDGSQLSGATDNNNAGGGDGGFDGLGGDGGGVTLGPPIAWLEGRVLAPEGTIGIHEALIYATHEAPAPIPQQVFCDKCIELAADVPYTLAAPDGSFSLGVPALGDWKIVVQKGAFRRVSDIHVAAEGVTPLDPAVTTLPGMNGPGAEIPRMAVVDASYDSIKDTLAKLGLGQFDSSGYLVPGTERFDLYADGTPLLTDYATLSQYHVVFFGCDNSWPNNYLTQPNVITNLRNYVTAGGKLYVTDWSYDILRQVFDMETPLSWVGDTGAFDSAHQSIYSAPAIVNDPDMAAWLAAQGITTFDIEDNWTILQSVNLYSASDEDGMPQMFTPTTWVSSSYGPNTVSYQFGCGRALFSTYHTEAFFGATLAAQERALLYIILEVNVCIGEIEPPE